MWRFLYAGAEHGNSNLPREQDFIKQAAGTNACVYHACRAWWHTKVRGFMNGTPNRRSSKSRAKIRTQRRIRGVSTYGRAEMWKCYRSGGCAFMQP